MAEGALGALYRAVYARLSEPGAVWLSAHADAAPAGRARPYALFFWSGGGEANRRVGRDAELVLTAKVVADSQTEAFAGLAQLADRLNDQGAFDGAAAALDGGADWVIATTAQERAVHLMELIDGKRVYHEGFLLRVVMQPR